MSTSRGLLRPALLASLTVALLGSIAYLLTLVLDGTQLIEVHVTPPGNTVIAHDARPWGDDGEPVICRAVPAATGAAATAS